MPHCRPNYWAERLETVRALIDSIDAALFALTVQGVQSYTLDTGQTRVNKTHFDIASLRTTRASLLNELAVLEVRTGCVSPKVARPAF